MIEGGEPRMEGSSLLLKEGENCEWLAKIGDAVGRSYLCQKSEAQCVGFNSAKVQEGG